MLEHKDYLSSLNKARRKRSQKPDPRLWILILAAVLAVGAIIFAVKYMKKPESGEMAARSVGEQLQTGEPQTRQRLWLQRAMKRHSGNSRWRKLWAVLPIWV